MSEELRERWKAWVWIVAIGASLAASFLVLVLQSYQYRPAEGFCHRSEHRVPGAELVEEERRLWPPGATCKIEVADGDGRVVYEVIGRSSPVPSLLPLVFGLLGAKAILWVVRLRRQALAPLR